MSLNIEAEGFTFKYDSGIGIYCYTKPYDNHPRGYTDYFVDVIYVPSTSHVLICQGDDETPYEDWDTMFAGRIETQEDFRKVLSMVII